MPLLYSQTFFCHLAHFLRNFRKKIIPYHISERFSAIWSVNLKKLQYCYTLYFLPWRCGYSRIAQTNPCGQKLLAYIEIAEQSLLLGYFFLLSTKLFGCVSLFVDFWNTIQSIPAPFILPSIKYFNHIECRLTLSLGYAL